MDFPSDMQVNYVDNDSSNNPHSNTYSPGWRNYMNFSWSNQEALGQQFNLFPQQKKPNLKDMFQLFMKTHTTFVERTKAQFQQYDA